MNRCLRCIFPFSVLLVSFAGRVRADIAPPPPEDCPPGSRILIGCGAAFCRALDCQSDADCQDGAVCKCTTACVSPFPDIQPPTLVHGGPCSADDTCSKPEETCQAIKLCLPPDGGATSGTGGEAPICPATGGTTGTPTTGDTSIGTSSTAAAPTSGDASPTASSSGTAGSSSDTANGPSRGDKGGCSPCTLTDGSHGLLVVLALAGGRRRRSRSAA